MVLGDNKVRPVLNEIRRREKIDLRRQKVLSHSLFTLELKKEIAVLFSFHSARLHHLKLQVFAKIFAKIFAYAVKMP